METISVFSLQRLYLISTGVISIILSLLNIRLPSGTIPLGGQFLLFREEYIDFAGQITGGMNPDNVPLDLTGIILTIYLTGVCIFLVRLIYQAYILFTMIRQHGIERKGKLNLIYADTIPSPFSIFNVIFLNRSQSSARFPNQVIAHEEIHASQKHTLDLLFIELLLVFQWFNPVVFLIRKSIKEVHEFLADEGVLQRGIEPVSYIGLLVQQVSRKSVAGLGSQFNSLTKKRIIRLTNSNVKKKFRLRYLFILPLISLLFFAFSTKKQVNSGESVGILSTPVFSSAELPWSQDATIPSICPVDKEKCKFTSGFGERIHPIYRKKMMHKGVDLAAAEGTPVKVTADGIVEKTEEWPEGYGKYIIVVHNDLYVTLYAQLSEIKVEVGDKVENGKVIGLVGSSGLSTAPHLHYEVRMNGEAVDPSDYFDLD
jgi:murein DD-endopeptidase MepM/ murein hydrolase activator NlpD